MAEPVRGVVRGISEKPFGDKVLYSFTLQNDRNYYGTGERKAPVEIGKAYEFETRVSPTGRISVDLGTLRPWEGGPAMQAAPAATVARKSFSGGFKGDPEKDAYWKNKEARDVHNDKMRELGATRNTALTLVSLMLANGAVKLPAKENAREAAIYSLFEHYTDALLKGKTEDTPEVEDGPTETTEGAEWK